MTDLHRGLQGQPKRRANRKRSRASPLRFVDFCDGAKTGLGWVSRACGMVLSNSIFRADTICQNIVARRGHAKLQTPPAARNQAARRSR